MKSSIALLVVVVIAGASLCVVGCTKKEGEGEATSGSAASAAKDCGADYTDPQKEFCIKMPAGFAAGPFPASGATTEVIQFKSSEHSFFVSVGFSSPRIKSFEEQLQSTESVTKLPTAKIESSGKSPSTGSWWVWNNGTEKEAAAVVKSNGNKAISLHANGTAIPPGVIEACKSLRAYPK